MSTSTPEYKITERTIVLKIDYHSRKVLVVSGLQPDVATSAGNAGFHVKWCSQYFTIFDRVGNLCQLQHQNTK